jgi:hypothetical protein
MRKGKRTFASRKRKIAGLLAFVLAGAIGVGAYAFTAQNTIKSEIAGVGSNTLTSYEVTGNDSYKLKANGTTLEDTVFVIKSAEKLEPSDVEAALSPGAAPTLKAEWADCGKPKKEISPEEWEVECPITDNFETGDHLWVAAVSEGKVEIE